MSIYRAKNGKTYTVDYYSSLGKRVRKAGFKTKTEAEVFERKMLTQKDNGISLNIDSGKQTVEDFYFIWLGIKKSTVTLKTLQNYKEAWKSWVSPKFQNIQVKNINPVLVREWLSTLKLKNGDPAGYETSKRALTVLGQILDIAVESSAIQFNPVKSLTNSKTRYLPKPSIKNNNKLSFQEILKIADLSGHYSLFIKFLALTGLRQSEAIALKKSDFDLDNSVVHVSKAFQTVQGKLHLGSTKNNKPRDVHISNVILADLKNYLSGLEQGNIVFLNTKHGIIDMNNFRKRIWGPILKTVGLKDFTPNDLRKFFTTESADLGVPLHLVSELDGHSSVRVTMDHYLKSSPSRVKEEFEKVDRHLMKEYMIFHSYEISGSQEG